LIRLLTVMRLHLIRALYNSAVIVARSTPIILYTTQVFRLNFEIFHEG
jgi:hypothetical protein